MKVIIIAILTLITWFARQTVPAGGQDMPEGPTLVLGLLLISALVAGKGVKRINVPMLTGFILYGILAGPHVLNIITIKDVELLSFTDFFALSLIAITAGGELRLENIRRQLGLYLSITGGQFVIITLFTVAAIWLGRAFIPLFNDLSITIVFIMAMVASVIMVANSPATVIAVLKELNVKGKNSDLLLGVAVFKDIFIILFFAILMASAASILNDGGEESSVLMTGLVIGSHIFYSVLIGGILGLLLILGIKYFRYNLTIIILLVAVGAYVFVNLLHLEAMLTCMVAGFTVQNFSRHGEELIQSAERSSLPFYIIFFTLAGVKLDFSVLAQTWPIALSLVVMRMLFMFISTSGSVWLMGGDSDSRKYLWMGYLSQAGVSLGLVAIFKESFSAAWAQELATVLIAVIAVNQIIGPVFLRYTLEKVKEIPK